MKSLKEKLDKEERVKELNPDGTLNKIGLKIGDVFCDIGAGTGVFTLPASKISTKVYALDINEEMLGIINEKAKENNIENIVTIKVDSNVLNVESQSCNMVFMSTVLHEIESKNEMLSEIHRILKEDGKLSIIEFHKKDTSFGPPVSEKISPEEMDEILNNVKFKPVDCFNISDKFYCKVYKKE